MLPKSYKTAAVVSYVFSMAALVASQAPPVPDVNLGEIKDRGCYSSFEPLEDQGVYTFQSSGHCQKTCGHLRMPVMALVDGERCFCGHLLPAEDTRIEDSECNTTCNGYSHEFCGGPGVFRVSLTGITRNEIDHYVDPAKASSSAVAPASPVTIVSPVVSPSTIVQTVEPTSLAATESDPEVSSEGPNKAGIAAGVVTGVLLFLLIIGGTFLFLRRRKQRAAEETYKRNAAISGFIESGKGSSMMNDGRLDPTVLERRQSDGSIADSQDYSRRILKVTNPDYS